MRNGTLNAHNLANEKRKMLQEFKAGLKSRIHGLEEEVRGIRKALQSEGGNIERSKIETLPGRLKAMGKTADTVFGAAGETIETVPSLTPAEIAVGDTVYSRQLGLSAEVVSMHNDEVTLQAGLMRITVPVGDLQKPVSQTKNQPRQVRRQAPAPKKPARSGSVAEPSGGAVKRGEPSGGALKRGTRELDVRGERVDEALQKTEKFIDDALLMGAETVAIIHGHGTGALKAAIRELLRQTPTVRKFYPSQLNEGGDGRTVIEL